MIATQQQNPRIIGFPPVLISLTIFVLRPMAAIARIIKNLLSSFIGEKTEAFTPSDKAIVVIIEANIKYKINIGKICFRLTDFSVSDVLFSFSCALA